MKAIKREVIDQVPVGTYLVYFQPVWGVSCNEGKHDDCLEHGCMDNEPDHVAEVEPEIIEITETNYLDQPVDIVNKDTDLNAEPLFEGDTHDFRPRLFLTESEAKEHVKDTMDRFTNAQPWESFLKFD